MDTSTLILFVCCLLFSGFNLFINMKIGPGFSKFATYALILIGDVAAFYILVGSFLEYIK